jgi:hypothetical protein
MGKSYAQQSFRPDHVDAPTDKSARSFFIRNGRHHSLVAQALTEISRIGWPLHCVHDVR